ncbi:efflux RND transporter permease subunit [Kangiella aquimarina]|uniref:Efflux RND transporter permease subunit n=1 Tax=Kangiella aquimarina TaxID=261965 RepID=A0ABZ0X0T2_9GAMM|nr:efflux RND transporter permease subunit [Kangiella aquimarina]WQG84202.1 efflux RND transporter permease subunit [Kangiella aquimarina]
MVKQYDTHSGIISWFARNSVAANLLMIFIIVAGFIGLSHLRQQVFPDIIINSVSIQVPYPGAAPQEVEEGIVILIEENIKDIEGIKKVTSTASEGMGSINIEIEDNYEVSEVMDEIKVRVDAIPNLPDLAERPVIYENRMQRQVMRLNVFGDANERTLKEYAKDIKDELLALPHVSLVEVEGARPYEVGIQVSDYQLRKYGLTLQDVANAVRSHSLDLPSGTIKTLGGDILVRTKNQAYDAYDFAKIPVITRPDGTTLLLADIAAIDDGFAEWNFLSRFDGKPTVSLRVRSSLESDDLLIAEQIYSYLDKKTPTLPAGISIEAWGDGTYYLKGRLEMMQKNMLAGIILVFIVLALFLRFKLAFWVMIGIPLCFLGAFALMYMYPGFAMTINMITLFGFILVLGIVVDDAIIIAESAWASIEEKGHSIDSVVEGAKRVALPATFGVLTTIAAFYPMLAISGPWSNAMASMGLVVMFCLMFSLIESKLILPAHLAHMKLNKLEDTKNPKVRAVKGFFRSIRLKVKDLLSRFINNVYKPKLETFLNYRGLTILTFVCLLFITTIGFIGSGWVKTSLFPNIPNDGVFVEIKMAEGATAEQAMSNVQIVWDKLNELHSEVEAEHGIGVFQHAFMWTRENTGAYMWTELVKSENLPINQFDLIDRWRDKVGTLPAVEEISFGGGGGGPGGDGVGYRLVGTDIEELQIVTEKIRAKLAEYDGVYDISDNLSGGKEEIVVEVKPHGYNLGLSTQILSQQVRNAFYGSEAQRFLRDNEEVKVFVRYPLDDRRSIGNLEQMPIRTPSGEYVTFTDVANYDVQEGFSRISRIDGVRANRISADVSPQAAITSGEIHEDMMQNVIPDILAQHPTVKLEPGGPSEDQQKLTKELGIGGLIALILIYGLMAIPLKSYIKPVVVMSAIPFGIIGAMVGHLLLDINLSMFSFFGIIALSGVVVNDSLLMVDFIGRARAEGMSRIEAAINAGTRRFRAIILTSLTTFFGLLPITTETSLQAQLVIPMAVSLAFGIVFATVITLIWVPCLYVTLGSIKDWFLGRDAKSLSNKEEAYENN